jgi:protein-L-isoaspartate(D-aspartate) O-methyltransferase
MNKKELISSLRKQDFSENILNAFEKVKREDFISKEFKESAYEDIPLPIGGGQTISQPYTIAFMLTLLELYDNQAVLEIGSGSGYVLALINELSKNAKIYGVERIKELAENSKKVLKNKKNIEIFNADGIKGLKEKAPFDRILVSASSKEIPQRLLSQLKYNGILVCVVKDSIVVVKKTYKENKVMEYPGFIFVPLIED